MAKSILEKNAYVDDVLFGSNELTEAKETQKQVTELMKCGGFHLRKSVSNSENLLRDCPEVEYERAVQITMDKDVGLGLFWEPNFDNFQFKVFNEDIPFPTKHKLG